MTIEYMNNQEITLLYDGSYEGLLTAIFVAFDTYKNAHITDISPITGTQNTLFGDYINIETDETKFERVQNGILDKLGMEVLETVYEAYLSEMDKCGLYILEYLQFAFQVGNQVNLHFAEERVTRVLDLKRKVGFEIVRLAGFVRFKDIGYGVLYARICPTYNVVAMLMQFFIDRLPGQRVIIYDEKRNIYAVYDGDDFCLTDHIPFAANEMPDVNADYEALWKVFFNSIAIEERKSRKRQMALMPKKYWKNIVEKMGDA